MPQTTQDCVIRAWGGLRKHETGKFMSRGDSGLVTKV